MATPLDKPILSPLLVGRVAQVEALERVVQAAHGGAGRCLLLAGEAGIGKSRLVAEAKALAAPRGFAVLQGNCFEPDRALPYAPWLDLLRAFCAACPADELRRALGASDPDLVKLLPELAARLPDLTPFPALEPEQEKRRLFESLAQFFLRQTPSPLLLIVEDLHWGDDLSLEFLLAFVRRIAAHPILLLLTYRSDEASPALTHFLAELDRARLAAELPLARLPLADTERMIRAIFEQPHPVGAEFAEAIHALTDGNPFFVEEILKSLVAAGEIFYSDGGWTRKPLNELHIPRTVQDAVARRVGQLSDGARQLLTLAAVTGRRFDFALLPHLTGRAEADLLPLIKELIAAQLVVEESADRFAFRHALTRQAVYAGWLARERKTLHRAIAETMERVYAGALDAHAPDLAHHFYEAGLWEKALAYARQAGEKARALYAPRAAVEHFTQALSAAQNMNLIPPADLHRARAKAYQLIGIFEPAHADLEAALQAARTSGNRRAEWETLLDLGLLWTSRDYTQTGDCLRRALELARTLNDPAALAHSLNRLGNYLTNLERPFEGLPHHQEALEIFERLGDRQGLAESFDLTATTLVAWGDWVAGPAHYRKAAALFRELDNRQGLASSLSMSTFRGGAYLNDTAVTAASFAEAVRDGEAALDLARQTGQRSAEAVAHSILAFCLGPQGEYARALSLAQTGLHIAEEIEHRHWMAFGHLALGALYLDLLTLAEAREHLEQALALAGEIGSQFFRNMATAFLISTYVLQGETARPRRFLNRGAKNAKAEEREQKTLRSLHLRGEILVAAEAAPTNALAQSGMQRQMFAARAELALAVGDAPHALRLVKQLIASAPNVEPFGEGAIPRLGRLRGEALAALGRVAEAGTVLTAAYETAHTRGMVALQWRILISLGKLHQARGRRDEADDSFATARAIVERLASGLPEAALRDNFLRRAAALIPATRPVTPLRAAKRQFGGLTKREREVVALIAQGKSNRQIAEALTLSHRTVEAHVASTFSKLGFTSRAQIAAWAVETGMTGRKD